MARHTVHVPQSDMAMGLESPLSAIEAYYKVRELREMGFQTVSRGTPIPAKKSTMLYLSFGTVPTPECSSRAARWG